MSRRLRERLSDSIVVFDIDGVLAVYEFGDCCHTSAQWGEELFRSVGDNPYCYVNPVPVLQDFINNMRREDVYVCSVAEPWERECKAAFVTSHYDVDPSHILFVESKKDKLGEVINLQDNNPGRQIAIVDDTVKTLDGIWLADRDILTVHVTSFFDVE